MQNSFKTHEMRLNATPFELIKNGKKIYEIRLFDEKRKLLKVNDFIIFKNISSEETIKVKIDNLKTFKSFKNLFSHISCKEIGFNGTESEKEMLDVYYKYYTKYEEQKYGVLAINIKRV